MSAAPAGAFVRIYVDGLEVLPGDALRTPTGRTYMVMVMERRVQQRGKHVGRQHLGCLIAAPDAGIPEGTRVRRMHWYKRGRKK